MSATHLLVTLVVTMVVATILLALIARMLYTLRLRPPVPPDAPVLAPLSRHAVRADTPLTPGAPMDVALTAAPDAPAAAPTPSEPPPREAVPAPTFYEYTEAGLVPVDPHAPTAPTHEARGTTGEVNGDSDPSVAAEDIVPEDEGFVWL